MQLILQARNLTTGDGQSLAVGDGHSEPVPFSGIGDFCRRVDLRQVNKRGLECLIKAGALDALGERAKLLAMIDRMMKLSDLYHQASARGQLAFDALAPTAADDSNLLSDQFSVPTVSQKDLLAWEKELLGTYVSEHPLQRLLNAWSGQQKGLYTSLDQIDDSLKGRKVVVTGRVIRSRVVTTRKGDEMAFVELEDLNGSMDVVVFPKTYSNSKELLVEDQLLVIEGRVDVREGKVQIVTDSLQDLALADIGLAAGDGGGEAPAQSPPVKKGGVPAPPWWDGVPVSGLHGGTGTLKASVPRYSVPPLGGAKVHLLEINLHCTGNRESDVQLMRSVYEMLEQRPGPDRFLFNIISDKGRVQLDFPNATTRFESELENALRQTLGADALYVQWTEA